MGEFGRELAGWMATLEGGSPFCRGMTAASTLERRRATLRRDLASLEASGHPAGEGVRAGRALLALLEQALE